MGIGDEIIASGHALSEHERTGKRVLIVDANGRGRWSGMWEGLNWIVNPHEKDAPTDVALLRNGSRCRPYIDYKRGFTRQIGMNYSGWRVRDHMGFIQLHEGEMNFGLRASNQLGPFVIVEPQIEKSSNQNKQWGVNRWQELVFILAKAGMNPIQVGPVGTAKLIGTQHVITPNIRFAAALMKFARWSILPDAGLMHAAGVLGCPATILWGGANDPLILGYEGHEHIYFPPACRVWMPCPHCRKIWQELSPEYVWQVTEQAMKVRYGEDYRSR